MPDHALMSHRTGAMAVCCLPFVFASTVGPDAVRIAGDDPQERALEVAVSGVMAPVTAHIRLSCPNQGGEPVTHILTFGPGEDDRIVDRSSIDVERTFEATTEVRATCRDAGGRGRNLFPREVLVVDEEVQRDSVVVLGNAERVRVGLVELQSDEELHIVAQAHARDMAERGYFRHTSPEGLDLGQRLRTAGVGFRAAGENIGGNSSAAGVVRAWLESPGHRANLLATEYTRIGVGVFRTPTSPYTYYVQVFAS